MDISSKACTTILDTEPKGKLVWDVLRLKPEKVAGFQKWLVTVFSEMLPFEDLAPLGPVDVPGLGKDVSLEYFPLRNGERIEAVVVVATDITNLVAAKKQAEIERERVKMILHLVQHKMEIVRFIQESDLQIKTMEDLANSRDLAMEDRESILRILHTLKGGAASFSISELVDIAHNAESDLLRLKSFDPSSIKNVSHELLQSFDKFKKEAADILGPQILNDQKLIEVPVSILESLLYMLEAQGLTSEATRIRESYLYEPVEKIFEPYQEMVERLALQLEKQVAPIEYHTNQITWSAQRHQSLAATLVHAFRNTLDHGIETPDERMAAGKSAEGHIKIFFEKNNDRYLIKIEDDGRGIDPARIRQKLDKQGFDHSAETDEQVIQHVFDSQFSTKDQVSELSGRGVGMDAIAYEAKKLGGLAYVKSKLKLGTVLIIEIPIQNKSNTSKAA